MKKVQRLTHNLSLDDVAGTEALAHLDSVHIVHAHILRSVEYISEEDKKRRKERERD